MTSFIYNCPASGLPVQGWVADETDDRLKSNESDQTFVGVQCPLCGRTHLVNPTTGRVLQYDPVAKAK